MSESKGLILFKETEAVELFGNGGDNLENMLIKIEKLAKAHVPILDTPKDRDAIRTNAADVGRTKSHIESMKKEVKADILAKGRLIDSDWNKVKGRLDALRDEVRKPLTDWEADEAARKAAEALAKEQAEWDAAVIADYNQAFDDATAQDDLFNRERDIRLKEEELARKEAERVAKEQSELKAKVKAEREAKLKEEAAAKAKADAEAAAQKQRELEKFLADLDVAIAMNSAFDVKREAQKAEQDRIEAAAQAKREAEEAAQRAEAKRLDDIRIANEEAARIERDKQDEINRLERENQERIAEENRKLAEQKRRDEDKAHRFNVKKSILETMTTIGLDEEKSKEFIRLVAAGEIDYMGITY